MTQRTRESSQARRAEKRRLSRWLLKRKSHDQEAIDRLDSIWEQLDADGTELDEAKNGRPKTKKWVLLH
ncbi:MAG: hypothetical protein D6791_17710 [Chloroflexi bacterium]|nr:MAG: hypothetical protein D6791_17710 [Chloroflexota bacterium]